MRFNLPQRVIYWAPGASDGYGRPAFATPVELPARWEDKTEETVDAEGAMATSSATVYLTADVLTGGALMLGRLQDLGSGFPANPKADRRVREILSKTSIPGLRNRQKLVTAYLK